ncbi:KHG/KDPG aldolase [Sesamum alatum]|uniref:KHG/KDPG aldolase n=1 Tax=Sesamum alatum TaxID=300844 RepID=A0AAE1XJ09_9LAMI|nr:KHG/KDPG aldolase [Sesamum alatum]
MMAVASSGGSIWPLNLFFSSSKIKHFLPKASARPYCIRFSSHFRCKNSHKNSVAVYPSTVADRVLMDIQNSGIIACLRAQSAEMAIEAARAALSGGISVLEITMSTPGFFEALQFLVQEYPSALLGVGTVLDRADAKDALKCGAKFLMSPAMVKEILDDVAEGQALYIPGAMTPTEILLASRAGAKIVKVYPVSALGGVRYIAAVKKPFPDIQMVASQGITIDSVGQYIGQGASSVVLSDAIFEKNAMDEKNFDRINQLARSAAFAGSQAVRNIRDNLS